MSCSVFSSHAARIQTGQCDELGMPLLTDQMAISSGHGLFVLSRLALAGNSI